MGRYPDRADRRLPSDLAGVQVDGGERAEGRFLAGDAQRREKPALDADGVGRALQRPGRFVAGCLLSLRHELDFEADAHVVDEQVLAGRVDTQTAPIHAAQGAGQVQRGLGAGRGEQTVVAQRLELIRHINWSKGVMPHMSASPRRWVPICGMPTEIG